LLNKNFSRDALLTASLRAFLALPGSAPAPKRRRGGAVDAQAEELAGDVVADTVASAMDVGSPQIVAEDVQPASDAVDERRCLENDLHERRCLENDLQVANGLPPSAADDTAEESAMPLFGNDDDDDDDDDEDDDDAGRRLRRKPASDYRDIVKLIDAFKDGLLDETSLQVAGLQTRRVSRPTQRFDL
jgi:hypothetical protein